MKTIFKYELRLTDYQEVHMPNGAEILCVQAHRRGIYLWAEVNTESTRVARQIEIVGTGHTMREGMGVSRRYIGTVQTGFESAPFVWHVYEYTGV